MRTFANVSFCYVTKIKFTTATGKQINFNKNISSIRSIEILKFEWWKNYFLKPTATLILT